MRVNVTCKPSLRLVASSGIVISGDAPAASRFTTSQRDLDLEAISLSLAYAVSIIVVLLVCTALALKLSAACIGFLAKRSTGFSYGLTRIWRRGKQREAMD